MHILLPPNVSSLFSKLIPVVTYDIISSSWSSELVLDFDYEMHRENENTIFDQIRDLGYETRNSILNLGSLAIFLMYFFIKLILWVVLK